MPTFINLNLLKKLTHWPIIQKVHYLYFIKSNCFINIQFQILFHLPTLFSPFPHGTFLHYRWIKIFRIRRWFSFFQTKFHKFCFTFFLFINLIYRIFTLFYIGFPPLFKRFFYINKFKILFHVHSPLLTKSLLIFFLLATKMFQFTKFFI